VSTTISQHPMVFQ